MLGLLCWVAGFLDRDILLMGGALVEAVGLSLMLVSSGVMLECERDVGMLGSA